MVKKRKDCYILRIQQSHHYPWAYCRYYAKLSPSFFTINLWTTPGNMPSHYLWIYCWFVKTLLQRVELIILPSVWLTFIIIKVNSFIIFLLFFYYYLYRPPLTDLFIPFYCTSHSHPSISQRTVSLYSSVCFAWMWSYRVCNLGFLFHWSFVFSAIDVSLFTSNTRCIFTSSILQDESQKVIFIA